MVATSDGVALLGDEATVGANGMVFTRAFALRAGAAYRVRFAAEGRTIGERTFVVTPSDTPRRIDVPIAGG